LKNIEKLKNNNFKAIILNMDLRDLTYREFNEIEEKIWTNHDKKNTKGSDEIEHNLNDL
jgi:hypothetical protein